MLNTQPLVANDALSVTEGVTDGTGCAAEPLLAPRDLSAFFPPGWRQAAAAYQLQLPVWIAPAQADQVTARSDPRAETLVYTTSSYDVTTGGPHKRRKLKASVCPLWSLSRMHLLAFLPGWKQAAAAYQLQLPVWTAPTHAHQATAPGDPAAGTLVYTTTSYDVTTGGPHKRRRVVLVRSNWRLCCNRSQHELPA